jgi:AmiR/NasT family two-component response regulator
MTRPLRIAVADDEADMRDYYRKLLPRLGHTVVAAAENGEELIASCRDLRPDLVITDIKMPGIDGIEAAMRIYQEAPTPVILVSAYNDAKLIERAEADHIMGYLVKPIKQADLEPALSLATRRFEQFETMRREAANLRQALEDRKIIERAKGILMKQVGLSEPDAFRRMQKLASAKNLKLIELSRMILSAADAIQAS